MMAIPPFLVLGSPGTLRLRATPHRGAGRAARCVLSVWIAMPVFLMSFYGGYHANLIDPILQVSGEHVALEVMSLAAGVVFTVSILSTDPLRVRMTYPGRALDLFAEAAPHVFFGVFLMMTSTLDDRALGCVNDSAGPRPAGRSMARGRTRLVLREGPTVVMLVYVMHRWFRDDTDRAVTADTHADAYGDPELDAYNASLDALSKKDS